jgi:uncharacterized protein
VRLALVPRQAEFYELFAAAGRNAHEAAQLVARRFEEYPNTEIKQRDVKELEHAGDRLTADLIRLLNTQYITPFDREDIFDLARAIDGIVDEIEHASDLLSVYRLESVLEQAKQQTSLIVSATEQVAAALGNLRTLKGVGEQLSEIREREDEGDALLREALKELFSDESASPRLLIGWKDVLEALEESLDACDKVANLVGNIAVKN